MRYNTVPPPSISIMWSPSCPIISVPGYSVMKIKGEPQKTIKVPLSLHNPQIFGKEAGTTSVQALTSTGEELSSKTAQEYEDSCKSAFARVSRQRKYRKLKLGFHPFRVWTCPPILHPHFDLPEFYGRNSLPEREEKKKISRDRKLLHFKTQSTKLNVMILYCNAKLIPF